MLSAGPREDRRQTRLFGSWLLVVLVVASLGALPALRWVRSELNRAALQRLETVWAQRAATHAAMAAAAVSVERRAAPQDGALARGAVAALQREDAARLAGLARTAAAARAYGPTRRLRSDVVAALASEERALRAAAQAGTEVDGVLLVTSAPATRVESDFTALTGGSPTASARAGPVRLHAADAALQRMSRLLDAPLPVRLLVNGPGGPAVLDLAANRVIPAPAALDAPAGLLRGQVMVTSGGRQVLAVPLAGGAPTRIGPAGAVVAAGPGADQVWVSADGSAAAALLDTAGRVLRRVRMPGTLQGAVRGDLVVAGGGRFSVWDPTRGRTVRRLPRCGTVLAAGGAEVVLSDCPADSGPVGLLHVVDVDSGRDRVLVLPAGEYRVTAATLAPDGRHVAILAAPQSGVGQLFVADIPTGTLTPVETPGAVWVGYNTVWTPDSRRLFFGAAENTDPPTASPWTYRLGDSAATAIRYLRDGLVTPIAVLPTR